LTLDWVWAWSTQKRTATLVPEQVAYYRVPAGRDGKPPRFLYESSNGCALGGCLEEAVIHGILEVAERDAFLMAWYGQLSVGELDLQSLAVPDIQPLIDKATSIGYRVHLFDITNDLAIPAIWALVVSEDDSRPKSFSAAAAHPDPNRAVAAALYEAVVYTFVNQAPDKRQEPVRLRRMLDSPTEVRTLDDHVALYTLPEAYERFAHLFTGAKKRSVAEAFPAWSDRWVRDDLGESLRALLDHFHGLGLDVLVVDQTTEEQKPLGLRTVKVIVPGTLPMTFGHVNHRTRDLDRLLEVPAKLGLWPGPRRYEELTIHPHPFP
jgi:ribosomal protein S12 methylthiotransferase accessory factor